MSTELKTLTDRNGQDVFLTSFSGGEKDGVCLQFTPQVHGYFQLTRPQTEELTRTLNQWLVGDWSESEDFAVGDRKKLSEFTD